MRPIRAGSGGGFAVCITIGDNHSRAFPRKHLGNAKADTACGAGDNGGFTGKFHSNVPYESEDEFRDRCSRETAGRRGEQSAVHNLKIHGDRRMKIHMRQDVAQDRYRGDFRQHRSFGRSSKTARSVT